MTEAAPRPAVFGVVGWKNAGKTTMVERLVAAFVARGYRVATVKHAHHTVDVDHPGRDSFRHRSAGASEVAVVGNDRFALMTELRGAEPPTLDEVLARLAPADLVLVEGYKRAGHAKLEVRRGAAGRHDRLTAIDPYIVAVASDHRVEEDVPVFPLDAIEAIADWIEATLPLARRP